MERTEREGRGPGWILLGLLPLLGLGLLLALIVLNGAGVERDDLPPGEDLSVQRVSLPTEYEFVLDVRNGGPDPVTLSQVVVNDALWDYRAEPDSTIPRLGSAEVTIPYTWVEGEAYEMKLITSTGTTFDAEVPVAVLTPGFTGETFLRYLLIGLYVGIVPVALGLLWYPFLRRLGRGGMNFVLALTVGLLAFLVVDMWEEARETAAATVGALNAPVLIPLIALLTTGLLIVIGHSLRRRTKHQEQSPLALSSQIALGIGLHNLGEGLAIGAAFALGEAALGVFLILGFTLHNVTEGIGIAAPLVRDRPRLLHFVGLALLAGGPAILGTWIGAFVYSPFWTTIFLAVGIGAILQVIVEVGRLIWRSQQKAGEPALTWATFGGVAAGIAVMYLTALLVAA